MSAMAQDQAAAAGALAPQVDVRAPPKGVKFGSLLPMGVKGRQVTRKLFPSNGSTFSSATNNVIRIPLNGPFFLNGQDSYLSFDVAVENKGSAALKAAKLDSSVHSLINRLRIEGPDGSEIERIEDYASLHCFYTDFQQGAEHSWTQHGMSYVADRNGFPQVTGAAAMPNALAQKDNTSTAGDLSAITARTTAGTPANIYTAQTDGSTDELFFNNSIGIPFQHVGGSGNNRVNMIAQASTAPVFDFCQANSATGTGTGDASDEIGAGAKSGYLKVCLKLLSGVLANKRYLPLLALKGAGLTLELTLNEAVTACAISTAATVAVAPVAVSSADVALDIKNVEYVASTIEFDEAFQSTFMAMIAANGVIQFHGTSYHNFVYTFTAPNNITSTEVVPLPIRARSIKTIFCGMRNQSQLTNSLCYSISRRYSLNLDNYVFNIGSIRMPQAPVKVGTGNIQGVGMAYAEIVKAFSNMSNLRYCGRVDWSNYFDSSFAIAVDCETYSQDSSLLESGLDTASQSLPVRLELNFTSNAISTARSVAGQAYQVANFSGSVRLDTFAAVDVIYSITADGLMTASD